MVTEVHAQCFALHVPTMSICSIFHPVLGTHTSTTNEEHQTFQYQIITSNDHLSTWT